MNLPESPKSNDIKNQPLRIRKSDKNENLNDLLSNIHKARANSNSLNKVIKLLRH